MLWRLERNKFVAWAAVVIIATGIFYISTWPGNAESGSSVKQVVYHVSAFFFLAFFLFIASLKGKKNTGIIIFAFLLAIFYGILDEIHQSFTPGRSPSLGDVFLNLIGIFYAFMIYAISLQYREIKKW